MCHDNHLRIHLPKDFFLNYHIKLHVYAIVQFKEPGRLAQSGASLTANKGVAG